MGQDEKSMPVHTTQIRLDHSQDTYPSVFLLNPLDGESFFYKALKPLHWESFFFHLLPKNYIPILGAAKQTIYPSIFQPVYSRICSPSPQRSAT